MNPDVIISVNSEGNTTINEIREYSGSSSHESYGQFFCFLSTFVGYLMSKPSFQKKSSGTI